MQDSRINVLHCIYHSNDRHSLKNVWISCWLQDSDLLAHSGFLSVNTSFDRRMQCSYGTRSRDYFYFRVVKSLITLLMYWFLKFYIQWHSRAQCSRSVQLFATSSLLCVQPSDILAIWLSGNAFLSISIVALRLARLVLELVGLTLCGQVNHLTKSTQPGHPSVGRRNECQWKAGRKTGTCCDALT